MVCVQPRPSAVKIVVLCVFHGRGEWEGKVLELNGKVK